MNILQIKIGNLMKYTTFCRGIYWYSATSLKKYNEIHLLIKYIKSVLWRVAERLSYIQDAWCLKVKYSEKVLMLNSVQERQWKYTLFNKNQAAWNFLGPELEVTRRTVSIIIRVVLLSLYLCIRGVSLSSIQNNQLRRVYINQRHQHIRLIWS